LDRPDPDPPPRHRRWVQTFSIHDADTDSNLGDFTSVDGNQVAVDVGSVLEIEFTIAVMPQSDGDPIDLLFVADGSCENKGDNFFVIFFGIATAPSTLGEAYDAIDDHDACRRGALRRK